MGTFFGRQRTDPVSIEFALDLTVETVTLFERAPYSGWKRFAAAELDDPEFPIVIGLLRNEAEAHAGGRRPVRIWLPPDQVLRKRIKIEETTPEARLAAGFNFVERETVYRPEDVAIAVAPEARDGETTILITFSETWHEARDYVGRWGFLPGAVSTRSHATDFGVDGPVFRCAGQPIAEAKPRPRVAYAAAACLALAVSGGAAGWAYYPQITALIGAGSEPAQQQAEAPEPAPAEPTALAAAQPPTQPAVAPSDPSAAAEDVSADPPRIATPAETAPVAAPPAPAPVEQAAAPRPVEQVPPDAEPPTDLAAAPTFDLAPPRHVPTVPTLAPRPATATMPDLGPGLASLAAYTAPAGPASQTEAAPRPAVPSGPALPDPKLAKGGAWNGLMTPAESSEPLPKLAELDLADKPAEAIAHSDAVAALGTADPLGALPLPAPSHRPQTGTPGASELGHETSDDQLPSFAAPGDMAPPATESAALASLKEDSAGPPPPAVAPPELGTEFAAESAPFPPPAPGRPPVIEIVLAEPDAAATAAMALSEAEAGVDATAPVEPDLTEALAGFDITVMPDLDEARTALPFPPAAPKRDPAEDTGEAGTDEDAAAVAEDPPPTPEAAQQTAAPPDLAIGLAPETPPALQTPFAPDPAELTANLDVTVMPDLDEARASLPFPPAAPNRDTAEDTGEASTDVDTPTGTAEVPAEPSTATEGAERIAAAPSGSHPGLGPETPAAPDPTELIANLDITVVPDLDQARTTLPFPPQAPNRPAANAAPEEDEDAEEPGIGPQASALPKRRPAHLTQAPAPEVAASIPVDIRGSTPASTPLDRASVTALLPHGALIPEVEPDPDSPTRQASLTSPQPAARPALPPPSLPAVNALRLPKLSPGSVREAATEQGLPLDRVALIGILDLESGRKALLRMPDGRYRSVVTGDTLDGWRVSLIGVDAMRVTRSGEDRTLLLVNR